MSTSKRDLLDAPLDEFLALACILTPERWRPLLPRHGLGHLQNLVLRCVGVHVAPDPSKNHKRCPPYGTMPMTEAFVAAHVLMLRMRPHILKLFHLAVLKATHGGHFKLHLPRVVSATQKGYRPRAIYGYRRPGVFYLKENPRDTLNPALKVAPAPLHAIFTAILNPKSAPHNLPHAHKRLYTTLALSARCLPRELLFKIFEMIIELPDFAIAQSVGNLFT